MLDSDGPIPGTVDVWHDLIATELPADCVGAIKNIVRQAGRVFAPSASEFLTELREVRLNRTQLEEGRRARALALEAPREKLASPEMVRAGFEHLDKIIAAVPRIGSARKQLPSPDETHNWKETYENLRRCKEAAKTNNDVPRKQADGSWR